MPFAVVREGFITRRGAAQGPGAVAVGPRTVLLPGGDVLCSCMLTAGLGTNDFVPVLYRSSDLGTTWTEQGTVWPHLRSAWSIFASLSRDAAGRLFLFGSRTPIDTPGEPFWSEATQGLKENELVWASSPDGRTWTDPRPIPPAFPGAAEAPGPLCVTRGGRWLGPYSPYNTFDPAVRVVRNQVLAACSDDAGQSWFHVPMLRFGDADSGGAEAWVIELSDGRQLATCWQVGPPGRGDHPNAFALSHDGGRTWTPTASTGILGQATALAALPGGRALFAYNQRRHGEVGVWLAVVRPTDADFGLEINEIAWRAETPTRSGTSGEHLGWSDFAFGEPSVTVLPGGTLLVALWCLQPSGRGIRYVQLQLSGY
jgi:hypothetical protein